MFRTEDAGRDTTGIWVEKVKGKKSSSYFHGNPIRDISVA